LKEIPFFHSAYITIQSALDEKKLVDDCIGLCRAAGAEKIYVKGLEETGDKRIDIIRLTCDVAQYEGQDAMLFPVQQKTMPLWREIYNRKMKNVTGAAYMDKEMANELLAEGKGYFIHKNGELLGIGAAGGNCISAVASLQKGAGRDIIKALFDVLSEDVAIIEVASDNLKAIELYKSIGFVATGVITSWCEII
jgi:hypothetical protein